MRYFLVFLLTLIVLCSAKTGLAAPPFSVLQAIVWVQCGERQGSGTVTHEDGYVLTNAHVVLDERTGQEASLCQVGFMDATNNSPRYFYQARPERVSYQPTRNQDFAILRLTQRLTSTGPVAPFPTFKTNEFPVKGERLHIFGFSGEDDSLKTSEGVITNFASGYIQSTATIRPGLSGGAGLDANNRLVGIPTRVVTITSNSGGVEEIHFELVDIRAVINWLDTFGPNEHDHFFTHEDYNRYHQNAIHIEQTDLGCEFVARTRLTSTVFCLQLDGSRLAFPHTEIFFSWFPDFDRVVTVSESQIARYQLVRNVTFKPGTLVKSHTSPQVYVTIDSFGTLRWIPTEQKAAELWGPNWAGLVKDIPDVFFANYSIGQPLET